MPLSVPRPTLVTMLNERWRKYAIWSVVVIVAAAVIELAMGRLLLCQCGYVKLWHGVVFSSENSQHLTDWYSFTHVLHGVGFYFVLWVLFQRLDTGLRFLMAVALEAAWEVAENTPFVIDRYRAATISLDYYGDSVVNSVADIGAMMLGFWTARTAPRWVGLVVFVAVEAALAVVIRDNLTLNIIMLIHPVDAIKQWQVGAG